ncbi:putative membrane protein [Paenibacillus phage vB_PlaP_API480]|nr:putative membrane protein [Paenibacillus phage vB_PlaP_API480]
MLIQAAAYLVSGIVGYYLVRLGKKMWGKTLVMKLLSIFPFIFGVYFFVSFGFFFSGANYYYEQAEKEIAVALGFGVTITLALLIFYFRRLASKNKN